MAEMIPSLPIETTDHMIDDLHDDLHALLACSLVSSSWRGRAQLYIFWTVDLRLARVFERLPPVLSDKPHLAAHIRELYLPVRLNGAGCVAFLVHCPLPKVTDLALGSLVNERTGVSISATIPFARLGEAFPGVRALCINDGGLDGPDALLSLIRPFRHLSSLRLRGVQYGDGSGSAEAAVTLDSLLLEGYRPRSSSPNTIGAFLRHISLRRLALRHINHTFLAQCIGALPNSVEELDIEAISREFYVPLSAGPRSAVSGVLRLCALNSRDARGDLGRLVRYVRDIGPGDNTHVVLVCRTLGQQSQPEHKIQWRLLVEELLRVPFPWKCTMRIEGFTLTEDPHAADVCATLDAMGITLVGTP